MDPTGPVTGGEGEEDVGLVSVLLMSVSASVSGHRRFTFQQANDPKKRQEDEDDQPESGPEPCRTSLERPERGCEVMFSIRPGPSSQEESEPGSEQKSGRLSFLPTMWKTENFTLAARPSSQKKRNDIKIIDDRADKINTAGFRLTFKSPNELTLHRRGRY